jgi:hypothetical protein
MKGYILILGLIAGAAAAATVTIGSPEVSSGEPFCCS